MNKGLIIFILTTDLQNEALIHAEGQYGVLYQL